MDVTFQVTIRGEGKNQQFWKSTRLHFTPVPGMRVNSPPFVHDAEIESVTINLDDETSWEMLVSLGSIDADDDFDALTAAAEEQGWHRP